MRQGELEMARATPLDVEPGAELRGINIAMRSMQSFTVRGKGSLPDGSPIVDQIFTIRPQDGATNSYLSTTSATPHLPATCSP